MGWIMTAPEEPLPVTTCDSCGARIVWVQLVSADRGSLKPHPLDAEPERHRRIVRLKGGRIAMLSRTWTSHFSTCPQADQWRTRGAREPV